MKKLREIMLPKFQIFSSPSELRFYADAGWTTQLLRDCLHKGGDIRESGGFWVLDRGKQSCFNIAKLLEFAGEVYNHEDNRLRGVARTDHLIRLGRPMF